MLCSRGGVGLDRRETCAATVPHQLILQERVQLELTGVLDVERFDDCSVSCRTSLGRLLVSGNNLNVRRLDIDGSALSITGKIDSLQYSELRKGGLFGRLLR